MCDLCFIKPVWEICTSITNYSFRQVIVKYVGAPTNQVRGGGLGKFSTFQGGNLIQGCIFSQKIPPFKNLLPRTRLEHIVFLFFISPNWEEEIRIKGGTIFSCWVVCIKKGQIKMSLASNVPFFQIMLKPSKGGNSYTYTHRICVL